MKLTPELKKQIDEMSYFSMLQKWRFAPIGEPIFQDESGEYFAEVMKRKKIADPVGAIAASKSLG